MRRILLGLLLALGSVPPAYSQASPYNIQLLKPQTATATNTTLPTLALNGLTTGSTVGSSYSMCNVTVTGSSLTTVTFNIAVSPDNGGNFFPVNLSPLLSPATVSTSITTTVNGAWQFPCAGMTHVRVSTSGTFTAASVTFQIGASPNGLIGRGGSGGGGSGTVGSGTTGQFATYPTGGSTVSGHTLNAADITGVGGLTNDTSGNADTATALRTLPSPCSGVFYSYGIDVNGNAICRQVQYSDLGGLSGLFYQTMRNAGTGLTQRPSLNFVPNSGISAVDNSGASATDVSLAQATESQFGAVKCDGVTITCTGGVIGLNSFTINSFNCGACTTVELGATVTNPAFTATYSATPVSAAITNTDGTGSPLTLTTPFTSGTVTGSFSHSAVATTTFTLTAISGATRTSTRAIAWQPRNFGGTGTGGSATGATASGTNAVLVGATGTLASGGLGSGVGQVYNVTTSGTQYIYLLLATNVSNPGGGSFTTPGPTVFAMNAPTTITFTNVNGASLTMYLYRSVNSYFDSTNFSITTGN